MAIIGFIRVVVAIHVYVWLAAGDSGQCWYPDGRTLAPDIPCNNDGSASACCNKDAWCLDNGLCLVAGVVSRGSCTDQSWTHSACASYCRDCNNVGGCVLYPCNPAESTWTCGANCANDDDDVFTVSGGNGIALRATQVGALQSGTASVVTIEPTSQLEVEGGGSGGSNSNDNNSEATQTAGSGNAYSAGDMAGVGVGVGVPLLLALLAALSVIMRQRKRLQRESTAEPVDEKRGYTSAAAYAPSSAQSPGYGNYPPPSKPSERPPGPYDHSAYARRGNSGEMDSIAQVNEMDSAAQRQELPAGK